MQYKPKTCNHCGDEYLPKGRAQKYCDVCGPIVRKQTVNSWHNLRRRALGIKEGRGSVKGEQASFYKHGKSVFDRYARERKQELNSCEECGKDLTTANRWSWVGHHIDHNQLNNVYSNLKILCKSCHQKEHKCWENFFEGATTISKESRADNSSKRTPPSNG